jgi:hypothetical protein
VPQSESAQIRSAQITELLPLISGFRHSQNDEAKRYAVVLQNVVRDLERLNDIEMICSLHNADPLRPFGGPIEIFFDEINKALSRE